MQVQYTKMSVLAGLAEVWLEFQMAAFFSAFNPVGAAAWLAARLAVARVVLWLLRSRLVVVLGVLLSGTVLEVGADFLVQAAQRLKGWREGFDEGLLSSAARAGVIGGAFGVVLGAGSGVLLSQVLGGVVGRGVREGAAELVGEVGAEVLTEGSVSALEGGGFDVTGFAATAGWGGGLGSLAGHGVGAGARQWRQGHLPQPVSESSSGPQSTYPRTATDKVGPAMPTSASGPGPVLAATGSTDKGQPVVGLESAGADAVVAGHRPARISTGLDAATLTPIPKLVHMIWPTATNPDPATIANIHAWTRHTTTHGWRLHIWTHPAVTSLFTDTGLPAQPLTTLAPHHDHPSVTAQLIHAGAESHTVSHAARWEALHIHGGLTIDIGQTTDGVALPTHPVVLDTAPGAAPYLSLTHHPDPPPTSSNPHVARTTPGPVAAPPNSTFASDVLRHLATTHPDLTPLPAVTRALPHDPGPAVARGHAQQWVFPPARIHTFEPQPHHSALNDQIPSGATADQPPNQQQQRHRSTNDHLGRSALQHPSPVPATLPPTGRTAIDAATAALRLNLAPEAPPAGLDRLATWIATVEGRSETEADSPGDCVTRAFGAFVARYGHTGVGRADDEILGAGDAGDANRLVARLGGSLTPVDDAGELIGGIAVRRGHSALVLVRPLDRPAHVFWIVADDRTSGTARWVDTQAPGSYGATARPDDSWGRLVSLPGTRVAYFDATGRPTAPTVRATRTRLVESLTDPSGPRRAGALGPPGGPPTHQRQSPPPTSGDPRFGSGPATGQGAPGIRVTAPVVTDPPNAAARLERTHPQYEITFALGRTPVWQDTQGDVFWTREELIAADRQSVGQTTVSALTLHALPSPAPIMDRIQLTGRTLLALLRAPAGSLNEPGLAAVRPHPSLTNPVRLPLRVEYAIDGIPLTGLRTFLVGLHRQFGDAATDLGPAFRFSETVERVFARQPEFGDNPDATVLHGYTALLYQQAAMMVTAGVTGGPATGLLRVRTAWDRLRQALPPEHRAFLASHCLYVQQLFITTYRSAGRGDPGSRGGDADLLSLTPPGGHGHPVHHLLATALLGEPAANQSPASTTLDLTVHATTIISELSAQATALDTNTQHARNEGLKLRQAAAEGGVGTAAGNAAGIGTASTSGGPAPDGRAGDEFGLDPGTGVGATMDIHGAFAAVAGHRTAIFAVLAGSATPLTSAEAARLANRHESKSITGERVEALLRGGLVLRGAPVGNSAEPRFELNRRTLASMAEHLDRLVGSTGSAGRIRWSSEQALAALRVLTYPRSRILELLHRGPQSQSEILAALPARAVVKDDLRALERSKLICKKSAKRGSVAWVIVPERVMQLREYLHSLANTGAQQAQAPDHRRLGHRVLEHGAGAGELLSDRLVGRREPSIPVSVVENWRRSLVAAGLATGDAERWQIDRAAVAWIRDRLADLSRHVSATTADPDPDLRERFVAALTGPAGQGYRAVDLLWLFSGAPASPAQLGDRVHLLGGGSAGYWVPEGLPVLVAAGLLSVSLDRRDLRLSVYTVLPDGIAVMRDYLTSLLSGGPPPPGGGRPSRHGVTGPVVVQDVTATVPAQPEFIDVAVPGDGRCLFAATLASARHQGVSLPVGTVEELCRYAADRLAGADGDPSLPDFAAALDPVDQTLAQLVNTELIALPAHLQPDMATISAHLVASHIDAATTSADQLQVAIGDIRRASARARLRGSPDPGDWEAIASHLDRTSRHAEARLARAVAAEVRRDARLPGAVRLLQIGMADAGVWNTWVGDNLSTALAWVLQIDLVVHEHGRRRSLNAAGAAPVHIRRVNDSHYDALRPRPTDQRDASRSSAPDLRHPPHLPGEAEPGTAPPGPPTPQSNPAPVAGTTRRAEPDTLLSGTDGEVDAAGFGPGASVLAGGRNDDPGGRGDAAATGVPGAGGLRTTGALSGSGTSGDPVGAAGRLAIWVSRMEAASSPDQASDSVSRAFGAFVVRYGHAGLRAVGDATGPTGGALRLVAQLGGTLRSTVDPGALFGWLGSRPGHAALVLVRPLDRSPIVFWLVADDRTTPPTPRWVDTSAPGLFDRIARPNDAWGHMLSRPGTQVALFDGSGYPLIADPAGEGMPRGVPAPHQGHTGSTAISDRQGYPARSRPPHLLQSQADQAETSTGVVAARPRVSQVVVSVVVAVDPHDVPHTTIHDDPGQGYRIELTRLLPSPPPLRLLTFTRVSTDAAATSEHLRVITTDLTNLLSERAYPAGMPWRSLTGQLHAVTGEPAVAAVAYTLDVGAGQLRLLLTVLDAYLPDAPPELRAALQFADAEVTRLFVSSQTLGDGVAAALSGYLALLYLHIAATGRGARTGTSGPATIGTPSWAGLRRTLPTSAVALLSRHADDIERALRDNVAAGHVDPSADLRGLLVEALEDPPGAWAERTPPAQLMVANYDVTPSALLSATGMFDALADDRHNPRPSASPPIGADSGPPPELRHSELLHALRHNLAFDVLGILRRIGPANVPDILRELGRSSATVTLRTWFRSATAAGLLITSPTDPSGGGNVKRYELNLEAVSELREHLGQLRADAPPHPGDQDQLSAVERGLAVTALNAETTPVLQTLRAGSRSLAEIEAALGVTVSRSSRTALEAGGLIRVDLNPQGARYVLGRRALTDLHRLVDLLLTNPDEFPIMSYDNGAHRVLEALADHAAGLSHGALVRHLGIRVEDLWAARKLLLGCGLIYEEALLLRLNRGRVQEHLDALLALVPAGTSTGSAPPLSPIRRRDLVRALLTFGGAELSSTMQLISAATAGEGTLTRTQFATLTDLAVSQATRRLEGLTEAGLVRSESAATSAPMRYRLDVAGLASACAYLLDLLQRVPSRAPARHLDIVRHSGA
ncbi:hypothetical protein [Micromonospora marina]|uniref:hypothetical protein n=1 Tax=Micromonospora marina TaxID=307120 RepID=UPI0034553CD0